MSFVSFAFVFLFAAILAARGTIGKNKTGLLYIELVIVASTIFYGWHVPLYLLLLLGSTLLDFVVARRMVFWTTGSRERRRLLAASLVGNLGVLAVFKYADFLIATLVGIFPGVTSGGPEIGLGWALPLGISFYTFQSLSYTIDVYRGSLQPVARFEHLFLFVSFFPQLVAGPIVRARDFLYQIPRRRRVNFRVFSEGAYLMIRGFFLKMVCANNLAPFVDKTFAASHADRSSTILALGALFFGCQIFCDFAGYSSIARGSAYLLGFRLPLNFDSPYIARSFSDFWRRWHISLSQWLRDYLYFSLGGNRVSKTRTYLNLMLVMVLGGLWHGAAWTYVAWGALHGAALALERFMGLHQSEKRSWTLRCIWFGIVQITVFVAWIVFRAPTIEAAGAYLAGIARADFGPIPPQAWLPLLACLPVLAMHLRGVLIESVPAAKVGALEKAALAALMLVATFTLYGEDSAFIYFQF